MSAADGHSHLPYIFKQHFLFSTLKCHRPQLTAKPVTTDNALKHILILFYRSQENYLLIQNFICICEINLNIPRNKSSVNIIFYGEFYKKN